MRAGAEAGFSLLEMLIALAVLSMAAVALVHLAGQNTLTQRLLEERAFAAIVAENRAIEALTSREPPSLGQAGGIEEQAGRRFRWVRRVSRTPDPDVLRVDVAVRSEEGRQALSEVTVFRGRS